MSAPQARKKSISAVSNQDFYTPYFEFFSGGGGMGGGCPQTKKTKLKITGLKKTRHPMDETSIRGAEIRLKTIIIDTFMDILCDFELF